MALVGTIDLVRPEDHRILELGAFTPEGVKGTSHLVGGMDLFRWDDRQVICLGAISAGPVPTSKFIGSFMFFRLRPRS